METWAILQMAYITGWAVAAPIGPVNLEIIRRILREGAAAGLILGLGAICIDAIYVTTFSMGFGAFLTNPIVKRLLFFIGGIFLFYLGLLALRDCRSVHLPTISDKSSDQKTPRHRHFIVGLLLTGSSPYTIVFWSAFALQFSEFTGWTRLMACVAMMSGCYSWVVTLVLMTTLARNRLGARFFTLVTALGGIFLIVFALRFLWQSVT